MIKTSKSFDLEERTAKFGESTINFSTRLEQNVISKPIISQLVRASTSIGANYMEANGASSKKDFANKISICKKEAKETLHWLRMIKQCFPEKREEIKELWGECMQLVLIFSKISLSISRNKN